MCDGLVVYDAEHVVMITEIIHKCDDRADALEYYEYNIAGSRGESHPMFVWMKSDPTKCQIIKGNKNGN